MDAAPDRHHDMADMTPIVSQGSAEPDECGSQCASECGSQTRQAYHFSSHLPSGKAVHHQDINRISTLGGREQVLSGLRRASGDVCRTLPEMLSCEQKGYKIHTSAEFAHAPAWSLRYASLVGMVADVDCNQRGHNSTLKTKNALRDKLKDDGCGNQDSVFLAKNGRDKRLLRPNKATLKERPSRRVIRRQGIGLTVNCQAHLKAAVAVNMMWARHPEHMRKLVKVTEMRGKGATPLVINRDLSQKAIESYSEKFSMPADEVEQLYEAFDRYDVDDSGNLDRVEVRQVLADLGLQPRTREEKVELIEALGDADLDGLGHLHFEQFLSIVKKFRERLRAIQVIECRKIFEEADTDCSDSLDINEVMELMSHLGFRQRTPEEGQEIEAIFNQCADPESGHVSFEEFQELVQRTRGKLAMMRREEELTIAKAFHLDTDMFQDFRADLPMLFEVFTRYDHDHVNQIHHSFMISMLTDIGIAPIRPERGDEKITSIQEIIVLQVPGETYDFPQTLDIIKRSRKACKELMEPDLKERFKSYDRDRSGELSMPEIYKILEEFKMLPKNHEEQMNILSVIDRIDVDGSGTLDADEFIDFFQRLTELGQYAEREKERQVGIDLGFDDHGIHDYRTVFNSLKPSQGGKVGRLSVVQAVGKTELLPMSMDDWRVRNLLRTYRDAPNLGIHFVDFLRTVHQLIASGTEELMFEEDQRGPRGQPNAMRASTSTSSKPPL
eukprot:gnl/TRDRNA2_/TRDRNA2_169154_c1_seq1.p1 gnl/TRDRNA2_/TRDRNA2_169154_c1~~gnl/TRDRNA2_/TRDRNA2_169154_c1_seq1.p1  ORF type:complete len:770 (+),score=131.17 gnl/TRDRNA2_/TRDRNA2_169154_c1_seq1:133-2310(+)